MRIVGGSLGGRSLAGALPAGLRPTSDKVREALFQLLGGRLDRAPFADLCAGTGAVGIEAFSRGAAPVVLVERDPAAARVIERNLVRLGLDEAPEIRLVRSDVGRWLERRSWPDPDAEPATVFLDPPYADRRLGAWLEQLSRPGRLPAGSLVIVERATRDPLRWPARGSLVELWSRRYGDTTLSAAEAAR